MQSESVAQVQAKPKATKKVVKQPQGDFTPKKLDEMEVKNEIEEEENKLKDAEDLVENNGERISLDNVILTHKEEFDQYARHLVNHLQIVSKAEFYPLLVEQFLEGITKAMSADQVKRLGATLQATLLRKETDERELKNKQKVKKKDKPQLKVDARAPARAARTYDDDEDYYDEEDDYN